MRKAFAETLHRLAAADPRVVLLTGDLGRGVLDEFARSFPARFVNAGVAEQNMVGVATGMAAAGLLPFVYSIVPFATLRPYEFIRNGPVLHRLPVRIVGVGAGFEYGHLGPTHHGLEDIGALRMLPGLTIVVPADHEQARRAIADTWELPGPVYYRLGNNDTATVDGLHGRFEAGGAVVVREGADLLLVATGPVATATVEAADALAGEGIRCTVAVVSVLGAGPPAGLVPLLERHRHVLTVEPHYVVGGLGSLVAECSADLGLGIRLVRLGARTDGDPVLADRAHLHRHHGLDRDGVRAAALRLVGGRR
jgi:transketolase